MGSSVSASNSEESTQEKQAAEEMKKTGATPKNLIDVRVQMEGKIWIWWLEYGNA
jgi:hypothetical protein